MGTIEAVDSLQAALATATHADIVNRDLLAFCRRTRSKQTWKRGWQ